MSIQSFRPSTERWSKGIEFGIHTFGDGTLPQGDMMGAIELYGSIVRPMVLDMLSEVGSLPGG